MCRDDRADAARPAEVFPDVRVPQRGRDNMLVILWRDVVQHTRRAMERRQCSEEPVLYNSVDGSRRR
jgi:hypothetical protein